MKVRKLIKKMYAAIFANDKDKEQKLYQKAIKKSLKGKKTQAIR